MPNKIKSNKITINRPYLIIVLNKLINKLIRKIAKEISKLITEINKFATKIQKFTKKLITIWYVLTHATKDISTFAT